MTKRLDVSRARNHFSRRKLLKAGAGYLALQAVGPRLAWSSQPVQLARDLPKNLSLDYCASNLRFSYPPPLKRFIDKLDPSQDVFLTEIFVAEIEPLLARWTESLQTSPRNHAVLYDLLAVNVSVSNLIPSHVTALRTGLPLTVDRYAFIPEFLTTRSAALATWETYLAAFSSLEVTDIEIYGVQILSSGPPQEIATEIAYNWTGKGADENREQRTGTWTLTWQRMPSGTWTITHWVAHDETRSRLHGHGFSDITTQAFEETSPAMEQLSRGVDHWRTVLDAATGMDVYGNHGISAGDIDGSGFDSLYVCQPSGLPNRLFRNRGDGTFEDITDLSGTGLIDGTASAIFADFFNRGHQDLLVVRSGGPMLFSNLGNGHFEAKPDAFQFKRAAQGTFTSVTVADYDRDGRLDIYLCTYSYYQGLSQYQFPSPYYDAQNGPPNFLFHNRGDGIFEDVTVASGMDVKNDRFSFAAEWCDYDNDGWLDLHVANDFGRKNLYRNNRNGTFSEVTAEAGVEDYGPGMSTCWFDYNNDGLADLYVANMWLQQGKRITADAHFLADVDPKIRALYQKHNAGNSLFENNGKTFTDRSGTAGTAKGGWSWSSSSWDVDQDGFADLYVTNGFVSGSKRQDLQSFFWRQVAQRSAGPPGLSSDYEMSWNAVNELVRSDYSWSGYQRNAFFLNHRDATFSDVAGVLGLDIIDDSRAFVLSDFTHSGRLQFALKNRTGPQLRLMRNDLEGIGDSLFLRLRGTKSNRDAIGAKVTVLAEGLHQIKFVSAGSGFASQHTKELCFGLGSGRHTVSVTVAWPSGGESHFENIPVNRRVELIEGANDLQVTPYRSAVVSKPSTAVAKVVANATVATWLIAPLFGPDLKLADQDGKMHKLSALQGHAVLLTFFQANCEADRTQVSALQSSLATLSNAGINIFPVMVADEADADPDSRQRSSLIKELGLTLPVLFANERAAAPWSVQFRYLFDRRRDMSYPTSYLLDSSGATVLVYQGNVEPHRVLEDHQRLPGTDAARAALALPYKGPYFGNRMTRDNFTYGIAFVEYGFLDEAQSSFEQVLQADPEHPGANFNLGTVLMMKKDYPAAETALRAAVRVNPSDSDAWNNLGMIAAQQSRYDEALAAFRESAFANPYHLVAVENMMKIYQYQAHPADAQRAFEGLVAKAPDSADLHLGLAMSLIAQQQLSSGKAELETAIRLRPGFIDAINNLGSVLLSLGDAPAALAEFNRCRQLAPDFDRAAINAALVETRLGHLTQARQILTEFLGRHPENAEMKAALNKLGAA